MDCGRCGAWLESPHEDGLFMMDEKIACPECHTVNQVGVDDDEPYEGADHGTAYVSHWTCKHGAYDATPCADCDAEDEAGDARKETDRG